MGNNRTIYVGTFYNVNCEPSAWCYGYERETVESEINHAAELDAEYYAILCDIDHDEPDPIVDLDACIMCNSDMTVTGAYPVYKGDLTLGEAKEIVRELRTHSVYWLSI
jgi:hypothetical protein